MFWIPSSHQSSDHSSGGIVPNNAVKMMLSLVKMMMLLVKIMMLLVKIMMLLVIIFGSRILSTEPHGWDEVGHDFCISSWFLEFLLSSFGTESHNVDALVEIIMVLVRMMINKMNKTMNVSTNWVFQLLIVKPFNILFHIGEIRSSKV